MEAEANETPLIDVRSPSEYEYGHIPGAINISLLNDEQRHLVGILFKKNGQTAAVELGFELIGHLFHLYIKQARAVAPNGRVYLYCWRGGLRSNTMAWILSAAGFDVTIIENGYKSYRRLALKVFTSFSRFLVISGATGAGKTEILHQLNSAGEVILDLEAIANHKGSVFGAFGQKPQSTQEHFENLIALELFRKASASVIWVEHESRMIGKLRIPDGVYSRLLSSPIVLIERSFSQRKSRILLEYGIFPNELLATQTALLRPRLGNDATKFALEALHADDKNTWVDIMLNYYDKSYSFAFQKQAPKKVVNINSEHIKAAELIILLISTKEQLLISE